MVFPLVRACAAHRLYYQCLRDAGEVQKLRRTPDIKYNVTSNWTNNTINDDDDDDDDDNDDKDINTTTTITTTTTNNNNTNNNTNNDNTNSMNHYHD